MSQLLAALASVLWGFADFAGGVASRTLSARRVTPWAQLLGMPLLIIGLFVIGWDQVTASDVAFGVSAGVLGFIGIVALYGALAMGTMSLVAPLTGALSAAIPVVWGLAIGEVISRRQWMGIILAVFAITLVAWTRSHVRLTASVALRAVVASFGFAGFFIALEYTTQASGQWPLVAGRIVSIALGFAILAFVRELKAPDKETLPTVLVAGNGDVAANIATLLALQTGPLGVTVVITSMYPAFTVLAAILVLHERPTMLQRIGILLALLAAVLLVV